MVPCLDNSCLATASRFYISKERFYAHLIGGFVHGTAIHLMQST